jgi:hypothetical protein
LITGDNTLRLGGHHANGRVLVDGVEAGDNRLLVVPDDDAYLPSGFLPLRIGERTTNFTVRLHRAAPIPVRVVDASGQPIAGSRVRLRARLSDEAGPRFVDYRGAKYPSSHWTRCLDLAVATTDARGLAELPWQPWEETVVIGADGPGHVRRELELPRVVPGGEPLELRVARGATLRGTMANVERWPELAVSAIGEKVATDFARLHCRVALRNAADGELETGPEGRAFVAPAVHQHVALAVAGEGVGAGRGGRVEFHC